MRYRIILLLIPLVGFQVNRTLAQQTTDSLFTWEGYLTPGTCIVHRTPGVDKDRPQIILIQEIAANRGPTVVEDLPYLAEQISRKYGFDPVKAFWVIRWGAYSYNIDGQSEDKELLLRATFTRTSTGRLSSPQWRVLTYGELKKMQGR